MLAYLPSCCHSKLVPGRSKKAAQNSAEAHPDPNDVVQHLLEGEKPGLDNDGDNAHDVEGGPPNGNKATEEEHPSPQLEVHHSLHSSICHC